MKYYLTLACALCMSFSVLAQIPEDALRMSWISPGGSARQQAIGGAMGSLGGDISSLFVNPAGLGLYKTSEFVITPGFSLAGGKSNFRGTDAKAGTQGRFNLGASGFVFGYSDRFSRWSSKAFSIGVNRTADFNNSYYYKGLNDYSSYSESMANEFFDYYVNRKNGSPGIPNEQIINDALDDPGISLITKMGLYTYLIDVDTSNGQNTVISRAEQAGVVEQENRVTTTGGITEVSLGFAANMDDKLYVGGSIGVPIVNYERQSHYREDDGNGAGNNEFLFSAYNETYTSKGAGVNAKLGLIFKPAKLFRVGLAIHTPTLYGLKDQLVSDMTTNIDTATGSVKEFSVNSSTFSNGTDPSYRYDLQTPWKFLLSLAYVLHEVADVTQQKGFITADLEYVSQRASRFHASDNNDQQYYDDVNQAVKAIYKGCFNARVGGELKFNTFMARLGFAYYSNPYKDSQLKAHRMNLSAGLGYRNKGFFVDLTYVHSLTKDVNFPYRVDPPRLNTYAELNNRLGTGLVTFGVKF